jgi:hypothetical protein
VPEGTSQPDVCTGSVWLNGCIKKNEVRKKGVHIYRACIRVGVKLIGRDPYCVLPWSSFHRSASAIADTFSLVNNAALGVRDLLPWFNLCIRLSR